MSSLLQTLQAEFEKLVALDPLLAAAKPQGEAGPPPAAPPVPSVPLVPAVPVAPPPQVQAVNHAERGVDLDVTLRPSQVVAAAEIMDRNGFAIDAVSGVDWMAAGEMEVIHDYFHPTERCRVAVRARIPRAQPEIPTISHLYAGANWHERETAEFFGIQFIGHPNLIPLLLPEDSTFHPLRKDFTGA